MTKKKKDIADRLNELPSTAGMLAGVAGLAMVSNLIMKILGGDKMFGLGDEDKDKPNMTRVEIKEMTAGIISAFIDEYQNKVVNLETELEDRQYKIERLEKEREEQYAKTKELKDQILRLETALADVKKTSKPKKKKKK